MHSWAFRSLGDAGSAWDCSEKDVAFSIVFVHGFIGDHLQTWTHKRTEGLLRRTTAEVRLPDLLIQDPDPLPPCHIFSIAHEAGITSSTGLADAAGLIRAFIKSYVSGLEPIAFVAHSFGGLACRKAIIDLVDSNDEDESMLSERVLSLLMLATPNSGAEIARAAKALGSPAARDMRPYNEPLAELNRDWTERVVNEGDPDLELGETAMLLCRSAVGVEDRVVPAASAAALASFSKTEYLNKNHRSICKAPDRDDPTYQLLRRFLDESVERIPLRERERTMRDLTQKLRRTSRTRGWVRAEQEHITLAPGDSSRMRCKVRNVRIGGLAKRRFNFCVWLPGQFPAARPVDYGWEIGQGILDQATFKHLSGSLRERFDELFQVNMIRIDQDGNSDGYHLSRREDDPGWVMLEFDSPNWVVEGQLYDKLEIELESWVDRGQGWYFYEAPRAIAGHLEVKLVAPFEAIPIANLGRSTTIEQTIPVGSSYLHTVTADGPIAPGNNLVWVFPANRNAGDRPHSPGDS